MRFLAPLVNVAIFLALAPLFEGVLRKLTAKIQSRQGPPLHQPYLDLLKLLGKERLDSAGTWPFRFAPLLAFAAILAVAAVIPFGGRANILAGRMDVILVIYLLTLGGASVLFGALAGRNAFGLIGASREMVTMIMVEPILAMTLILGAVKLGSLSLAAAVPSAAGASYGISNALMLLVYLLALQAFVARQPFDIAEAEVELLEGPFIEYSGGNYALFKYAMMLKQMFYAWLFVSVFLPFLRTGVYPLDLLIQLLAMFVVFLLIGLVGSTNPRMRIDQAVRYYAVLIAAALAAVGLGVWGH
ncbi:MAG: NADH-quinone oxidoreductase subunit H [Candidatus Aminicenantes bacterium]|nr:NADH-quinone oxidoreductase subunit H [Candidatus Aminicenantes bacterium]